MLFDLAENYHGAFRNEMVINTPVFRAYGHGEFLGLSKCLRCIEGCFPSNHGLSVLSFDNYDQALKCLESKTEIRELNWMGNPEMYIVPLCNPIRHLSGELIPFWISRSCCIESRSAH